MKEKIIIYGEMHGIESEMRAFSKAIRDHNPSYVLVEALGDLELLTKEDKEKANRKPLRELYQEDLTKYWIEFALEHDVAFIGIEQTKLNTKGYEAKTLKEAFNIREKHFIRMIESYRKDLLGESVKLIVVVGDTHLRTINTRELGEASPLQEKYKDDSEVKIIRSSKGEID